MTDWAKPTVHPYPEFDPKQDAEFLRKCMKGLGTDEKAIIDILVKRSNSQRISIPHHYKQMYGRDLICDLKKELTGNFESVIIGLMTPTYDYLASEIHRAVSGPGTCEDTLIEVLCTRGNEEIAHIIEAYRELFKKNMEDDIIDDTFGDFKKLLVSLCNAQRNEEEEVDVKRAEDDANALIAAGVCQWGTDESVFNKILASESYEQLAETFKEYKKLTGHTIAEAIAGETSGDFKNGLLAIVRCVENRPLYFAEKLYKSMKGAGTDERTLTRIVVSRCEVDMVNIKDEYEKNFGTPLVEAICEDTSCDYRRILIALIDGS